MGGVSYRDKKDLTTEIIKKKWTDPVAILSAYAAYAASDGGIYHQESLARRLFKSEDPEAWRELFKLHELNHERNLSVRVIRAITLALKEVDRFEKEIPYALKGFGAKEALITKQLQVFLGQWGIGRIGALVAGGVRGEDLYEDIFTLAPHLAAKGDLAGTILANLPENRNLS